MRPGRRDSVTIRTKRGQDGKDEQRLLDSPAISHPSVFSFFSTFAVPTLPWFISDSIKGIHNTDDIFTTMDCSCLEVFHITIKTPRT